MTPEGLPLPLECGLPAGMRAGPAIRHARRCHAPVIPANTWTIDLRVSTHLGDRGRTVKVSGHCDWTSGFPGIETSSAPAAGNQRLRHPVTANTW